MSTAVRQADVDAVEAFLAEDKTLDGAIPLWSLSTWAGEFVAVWNILDSTGSPAAQLRFTARQSNTSVGAINLIFRQRPIWRVDLDDMTTCHPNPHNAGLQSLPALVCGPHEHAWPINRDHLLHQDAWDLPYRRPLQVRRIGQGFADLAGQINVTLTPDQRGFDGPSRADLFDLSGQ